MRIKNLDVDYENLSESIRRNLYLRDLSLGKIQGPPTGYPNKDKQWLKYYDENAIITEDFNGNILDYLKEKNKNRLNSTAIEYFNTKMTYNEFFARIDNVAKSFLEIGVKEGDIVTLSLPNTPENLIALYALNKIGAIANLIDLRLKGEKLIHAINCTNSKLIIASDLFMNELDEVIKETTIDKVIISSPVDSLNSIMKAGFRLKNKIKKPENFDYITWKQFYQKGLLSSKNNNYESKPDDVVCILHTSGTSGNSKGVEFTNSNFNAMAEQLRDCGFGVEAGHKFLNQVPPFLAFNIFVASHFPLSRGVVLRLLPDYQPDIFYKNINRFKPNHTIAGPADWNSFKENKKAYNRDYSYLMTMVSGSDKINEKMKEFVDELFKKGGSKSKITEGYGMTEVGAAAVTNLPQINVSGSVGIPLPSFNICIYDNDNECELQNNQIGEICFSGPTVMKGYLDNIEATNEALRMHDDGQLWMHSGDLGCMDNNGSIYYKGRLKRIIARHDGIKVPPLDVEKVINMNPLVRNSCVIGVDDKEHGFGSIPIAVVTLNDESDNLEEIKEKIIESCKGQLSEKYIPKAIEVVEELPLTSVGKVDYRKLTEEYNTHEYVKKKK